MAAQAIAAGSTSVRVGTSIFELQSTLLVRCVLPSLCRVTQAAAQCEPVERGYKCESVDRGKMCESVDRGDKCHFVDTASLAYRIRAARLANGTAFTEIHRTQPTRSPQ
eukprot:303504-Rhodomonas_salina.1